MKRTSTRRQFHKAVAALGAASLAGTGSGAADEPADPDQAMFEIVRARHGKHLTEAQLKRIRQKIRSERLNAERLRRVRLDASIEPAFVFQADLP